MSCHISALCITLPCPVRGLVETTFGGREIHGGLRQHPSTPSKHLQHLSPSLPPPCGGSGMTLRRAPSNFTPPLSHKEGVQHASLLRFMLERRVSGGLFFRSACGRAVRIRSLTRKRCICYNSCLLGRQSKASQYPLISERLHTQVI